jgi:hypothetical protein
MNKKDDISRELINIKFMLYVGLLMASSIALASNLDEYSSVKPLLLQAFNNHDGSVPGEITGKMSDSLSKLWKNNRRAKHVWLSCLNGSILSMFVFRFNKVFLSAVPFVSPTHCVRRTRP